MASDEHDRLVDIGERWLRKNGFPVTYTELRSQGSREEPDIVGFNSKSSIIIEVKVSRQDFIADKKKPERTSGGIGVYRFYMTPTGLLNVDEIPNGWGLLEVEKRKVHETVKPSGNLWPALDCPEHLKKDWEYFQHVPDYNCERSALYSIARRNYKNQ